jgi:hypothetical protein
MWLQDLEIDIVELVGTNETKSSVPIIEING